MVQCYNILLTQRGILGGRDPYCEQPKLLYFVDHKYYLFVVCSSLVVENKSFSFHHVHLCFIISFCNDIISEVVTTTTALHSKSIILMLKLLNQHDNCIVASCVQNFSSCFFIHNVLMQLEYFFKSSCFL